MEKTRRFLSTKEVAAFLDVHEKMVYSLVADKGLPATKVTGKWRFPLDQVELWLASSVVNTPGEAAPGPEGLVVIAGSNDPLLERTCSLFNRLHPDFTAVFGNLGSMGGLALLARGRCQIAASHLLCGDEIEYNFDFVAEHLAGRQPAVVNFARRRQGIMVARDNPKKIKRPGDMGKKGVRLANRAKGTGTRHLLDLELNKAGVDTRKIPGYDKELSSHMEVGLSILWDRADCGLGIESVADMLGIGFVPMAWERFDLLIDRQRFFDRGVQLFLGMLQEKAFAQLSKTLSGYDLELCGKMVYPQAEPE